MSEALGREIFYIELWHFLALLVILGVNSWFYRHGEKGALLYRYLLLQLALLLWVVSKMLKTVAPDETLRWFFIVTQYLGVCFLGPLFLFFAWQHVFGRRPPRRVELSLYLMAFCFFMVVVTNPLHYLFYDSYNFYRDTFGPLFYIFSICTYLLITAGIILFFYGVLRRSSVGGSADIFVVVAALLPFFVNAVYTYRLFGLRQHFDYTPLFMTCSLAFFGIAAFRSRFLGVLPSAWKRLILELEDPLILSDARGRVCRVSKLPSGTLPEDEIRQNGRIYRLHRRRSGRKGKLFHYVDVTRTEELRSALEEKNLQLEESIEEVRQRNRKTLETMKTEMVNRSRRELHDILGHSLTQVIFLLRLERQKKIFPAENSSRLNLARSIIAGGLERLEERLNGQVKESSTLPLALGTLIQECAIPEVSLDFLIRGDERPLAERVVQEMTSCCREAITNAVKHGHPEKIDIVLLYGTRQLALILADNGSGCHHCRRGNGLSLMEEGLRSIGGTLAFWSEPGKGFQLTIRVPYGPDSFPSGFSASP